LIVVAAALIVAAVVHWAGRQIVAEMKAAREDAARTRTTALLQLFAPGIAASASDPRALLVWQPLASAARQMYPAEFAALDRAAGTTFPFNKEQLQAAHAEWTTDWLAWERAHDTEYKLKAAEIEHEFGSMNVAALPPMARARLDAVEREKLDRYQHRYQEYVHMAKALHALIA
jgi:hypothetical protein